MLPLICLTSVFRSYLIARIADCDFGPPNTSFEKKSLIISYCTHSGLRLANCLKKLTGRSLIISYCTHSGLRPIFSVICSLINGKIISYCTHSGLRLKASVALVAYKSERGSYLIARIADCDFFFSPACCCCRSGVRRSYLIARIADCDLSYLYGHSSTIGKDHILLHA